jgi:uncharacterized protein
MTSGPITLGERSTLLDALRGWALLGILVANMIAFIGFTFLDDQAREAMLWAQYDDASELLIETLIAGKFYSIFSLLFGIGFAIQLGRLEARGEGVARYLRRLGVLFLIGCAHLLLLWIGDIVALYAVMGATLLLFRRVSDRALLVWAMILWTIPALWSAAIHFGGFAPAQPLWDAGVQYIATSAGLDVSQGPLPFLKGPAILPHLLAHPGEMLIRIGDLVYQMRFTKVLGMFLIGLWVGRRALFNHLDDHARLLRRTAAWGIGFGLPLSLTRAILAMVGDSRPAYEFGAELLYCLSTPTLALGYAAAFALLWRSGRRRFAELAAPAGRMALTNYLSQTVLQSLVFYGYGLGLIAKLGLIFVFPLALALFAVQLAFSRWWLARYRLGPVEWVWRSLTYGVRQPMRRAEPTAPALEAG